MLTYVLLGATFAFAAVAQPGPLQAYLISQATLQGWRRTLPAALCPLMSDPPVVLLAVLVLSRLPGWFAQWLRLVGGVYVLCLAFAAFRTWRAWDRGAGPEAAAGGQTLLKASFVNLLNPNPWIGWSTVLGPLLLKAWQEAPARGIALLASFYGLFVTGLAAFIVLFGMSAGLGRRARRGLLGFSAVALLCFGTYLLWSGLDMPRRLRTGSNTPVPSQPPSTEITKTLNGFRMAVRGSTDRPRNSTAQKRITPVRAPSGTRQRLARRRLSMNT